MNDQSPQRPHNERAERRESLERSIRRHERRLAALAGQSRRLSWIRLGIVLAGIALSLVLFRLVSDVVGWTAVACVVMVFAIVANRHAILERGIRRCRVWIDLRRGHLARMDRHWSEIPVGTMPDVDKDHPFDRDLNITGDRSLLHLLDTSVSEGGRARLSSWLLSLRPDPHAIDERQRIVKELVPGDVARDRLALAAVLSGFGKGQRWRGEVLVAWLEGRSGEEAIGRWVGLLALLALLNGMAIACAIAGVAVYIWPVTFVAYAGLYLQKRGDFSELFQEAIYLEGALGGFAAVLQVLERFPVANRPGLSQLLLPFKDRQTRPSGFLRRIERIAMAAAAQRNGVLRLLLNLAGPWDYFFAWRLRRAREGVREHLPVWLDRWFEMEALSSLANYAWLNPEATFPVLEPATAGPSGFRGSGLRHPLIPYERCVPNDFVLTTPGEVCIVTGSNMSGKSTFLRTLGTTLVLAFSGGVVPAMHVRTAPFRLYSCINVSDSVNDGISYFYAEVGRLRRQLDAVRQDDEYPVLFVIDEIFRGTNNRERLIGAQSYVRALAAEKGMGMISTHDLDLVLLADDVPNVANYHFREEVRDGRMVFDYRLRPGPSPTTNALAIMRAEGLPVDDADGSDRKDIDTQGT